MNSEGLDLPTGTTDVEADTQRKTKKKFIGDSLAFATSKETEAKLTNEGHAILEELLQNNLDFLGTKNGHPGEKPTTYRTYAHITPQYNPSHL